MKKTMLWCVVLLSLCMACVGCIESTDPETGETLYNVDPNTAAKVEVGTEAAVNIATILAAFWPVLLPVAGAGAGALGAWRNMKPKLTEAQTKEELYYKSTASLVSAIETLKVKNPASWEKLKAALAIGPETENVIRALRGLPPKT